MGILRPRGWLLAVVAGLFLFSTVPAVGADPIADLAAPPRHPAALAATPLGDRWFDPPPGFGGRGPGTVLASRAVIVGRLSSAAVSTQLLVRSTDSKNNPVPVATTVIVPTAAWTGPGARPVVAYNPAIDSLGQACAPSSTLPRGEMMEIGAVQDFLARNYAVVVTDHEGPRQAYAAGRMAGHAVLDALRAAVRTPALGLSPASRIAVTGYSGGAIASGWAAKLAPTYAPELNLVGAAFGGTPADYRILLGSMNGRNGASTVLLAAVLGLAREYPELFGLFSDNGWRLGMLAKDLCFAQLAAPGVVAPIPVQAMSDVPDVVNHPIARRVLDETRMAGRAPTAPVFIYQGQQDPWIPREGAERLYDDWCARGARVRLEEYTGEHVTAAASGAPIAHRWIDDRLAGVPVPPGCSSVGR
ncbi:lipase family protein [Rhodococcus sp. NPDC058514]|uniref:lipase family protein n=1 Tax=unclassified Rhodococcus (in: high G+C Gram-positive bacteria) TaxID=192944 RepID=UPI00365B96FD